MVEFSCGCIGLDVKNGIGEYLIFRRCYGCGKSRSPYYTGRVGCSWDDMLGRPFGEADIVTVLDLSTDISRLISDGYKLMTIRTCLGEPK